MATFDVNYARDDADRLSKSLPPCAIHNDADLQAWIQAMPSLKLEIDLFMGEHERAEREAQQLILRDNNFGGVSRATDYYICDFEYSWQKNGRFDLVAVHWPSISHKRKERNKRRLVLVEVKFGDASLHGPGGIQSHIENINAFLGVETNLQRLKDEMVKLFNQKRALGLLNSSNDLQAFSDDPPILLLVLVNHDPEKSKLRESIASLSLSSHVDLRFAVGCFMGYGLFDQAIVPIDEAVTRFKSCNYSPSVT